MRSNRSCAAPRPAGGFRGQLPNLVAVDFYERGDVFAVVDALNGISVTR